MDSRLLGYAALICLGFIWPGLTLANAQSVPISATVTADFASPISGQRSMTGFLLSVEERRENAGQAAG